MTRPLAGITVVVTRPAHQAGPFIDMLQAAGAGVIALPALAIEIVELDAAARAALAPDGYDWVVYTSANAVESALAQIDPPSRCRVAAVGPATARALGRHGIRVDAVPAERADSEGLLALPALADVQGLRVLILRGVGGREMLRDQLVRRGAHVAVGEVYRRSVAPPAPAAMAALEAALARPDCTVVAVTSVEVFDGLLALVSPATAQRVLSASLLVPGERVAAAARTRQWTGAVIVASSAEDASMLAALETHLASRRTGSSA